MQTPRRNWFIGFTLDPDLVPANYRAEAELWRDRAFRGNLLPCWTFRGAQRKARRWNLLRSAVAQPGIWEVFGPLGKEE